MSRGLTQRGFLETLVVTTHSSGASNGSALVPLDAINAGNVEFIEQQYEAYKRDRNAVDPQWAYFFAGFELAAAKPALEKSAAGAAQLAARSAQDAAELQKGPGK